MSRRMKWFLIGLNFLFGLLNASMVVVNIIMDKITWMTWVSGIFAAGLFYIAVQYAAKWNLWRRDA